MPGSPPLKWTGHYYLTRMRGGFVWEVLGHYLRTGAVVSRRSFSYFEDIMDQRFTFCPRILVAAALVRLRAELASKLFFQPISVSQACSKVSALFIVLILMPV